MSPEERVRKLMDEGPMEDWHLAALRAFGYSQERAALAVEVSLAVVAVREGWPQSALDGSVRYWGRVLAGIYARPATEEA